SIANRSENARLLVIGTYRPVDVILSNHPVKSVKQSLCAHGRCVEIELEDLEKQHVAEMCELRFPGHEIPSAFVDLLYRRTDGNPLFVLNVLDDAASRSLIGDRDDSLRLSSTLSETDVPVPESIAQMIESRMERLTREEQNTLEIASVAG